LLKKSINIDYSSETIRILPLYVGNEELTIRLENYFPSLTSNIP